VSFGGPSRGGMTSGIILGGKEQWGKGGNEKRGAGKGLSPQRSSYLRRRSKVQKRREKGKKHNGETWLFKDPRGEGKTWSRWHFLGQKCPKMTKRRA